MMPNENRTSGLHAYFHFGCYTSYMGLTGVKGLKLTAPTVNYQSTVKSLALTFTLA